MSQFAEKVFVADEGRSGIYSGIFKDEVCIDSHL